MKKKENTTERKQKTITGLMTHQQIISVIVVVFLLLSNSIVLFVNERQTSISGYTQSTQVAAAEANARMRQLANSTKEILTGIANNYDGLWSKEKGARYFDKQKVNSLLINKRMMIADLETVFVFRPYEFMIFQSDDLGGVESRLALKEYLENCAESLPTTINREKWSIVQVKEQTFLIDCYYYEIADVYVGVAIRAEKMFAEIVDLVNVYDGAFRVTDIKGEQVQIREWNDGVAGVVLDDIALEGGLRLSTCFSTVHFELLQNNLLMVLMLGLTFSLISTVYMNHLINQKLVKPVKTLSETVQNIEDLNEQKTVPEDAEVMELRTLEVTLNNLLQEVVYNRMKLYTTEIQKKEQELHMLRAQLRPHFFLNAIMTINAMTYQNRNEDIRSYLMRLSGFLRYVMTGEESDIALEEELKNVDNYFRMQEIRYPDKAVAFIDQEAGVGKVRIPRFLLLTIVENAFKYAMHADDILQVFVQCKWSETEEFHGVVITVEDNGEGFSEEALAYYNHVELSEGISQTHIGIMNIKQTLQLHYGRDDLLLLDNAVPQGAKIMVRIPVAETELGERKNRECINCR